MNEDDLSNSERHKVLRKMNRQQIEDKRPKMLDSIRQACGEDVKEDGSTTDLHLEREDFMQKMFAEENGQQLLDLLEEGEWRVCERMGLSKAYVEDGTAYIDVPRWNNLVAHLKIVNSI